VTDRSKRGVRRKRTSAQISFNMSRVRSTGSEIENVMYTALREEKLRPKKHGNAFGHPDFIFVQSKVAVFCDSHFWHGYNWKEKNKEIRSNRSFWLSKIKGNMRRDRLVTRRLRRDGWKVFRFWEHEIMQNSSRCAKRVKTAVETGRNET